MVRPVVDTRSVRLGELNFSSFNPPRRVEKNYVKAIAQSIRKHGILAPLLVTEELVIGDGHRRHSIATALFEAGDERFAEVPVRIIKGMTADQIYEAQFTARKPQGVEVGYVWAKNSKALPKHYVNLYNRLAKIIGKPMLRKWCLVDRYAEGVAPSFVTLVFSTYRYTKKVYPRTKHEYDKAWMTCICEYIREHGCQREMKRFIDKEVSSPGDIGKFIKNDIPLPRLVADII